MTGSSLEGVDIPGSHEIENPPQEFVPLALEYPLSLNVYDEMWEWGGGARGSWSGYYDALKELGKAETVRRWGQVQRLVHQHCVTYNAYSDPKGVARPWVLDPIPLMIAPGEWEFMAEGLRQRARVIDAAIQDFYGAQSLLSDGTVPSKLVLGNPNFIRSCVGLQLPKNAHLHIYAAEVLRGPSGQLVVFGDRTQSPSGMGYALKNRLILSRVFPEIFRNFHVERLTVYFQTMRKMLVGLSPRKQENPNIVLLTPGELNESYFEHAFLARYLGFTLVQGADLTARNDAVFLKTLGGLERVDVILRRVEDDQCDPLALRGDSLLGVPGLVQAVRSGRVAVANSLGCGLLETPGLFPYLDRISRRLFGEELKLPSVQSWWCGEPGSLRYVLDHLPCLVIRSTFGERRADKLIFGSRLSQQELGELKNRIVADPDAFVAQLEVMNSNAPTWVDGRVQPNPVARRLFLTRDDDDYRILPGGITRVEKSYVSAEMSMIQGNVSKDTWVLSADNVSQIPRLPQHGQSLSVSRRGGDLPSRVADNLFWLGRYIERADSTVRLLRAVINELANDTDNTNDGALPLLVHALSAHAELEGKLSYVDEAGGIPGVERNIINFLYGESSARSIQGILRATERTSLAVRDRISSDALSALKRMNQMFQEAQERPYHSLNDGAELLDHLVVLLAAVNNLTMENISRGQAWIFGDMGRRLERVHNISRMLGSTLVYPDENEAHFLPNLLDAADVSISYRRRYMALIEAAPAVDLILLDETNPRSVVFQLSVIQGHVDLLPDDGLRTYGRSEKRLAFEALTRLRLCDGNNLCEQVKHDDDKRGKCFHRPKLDEILSATVEAMTQLSYLITTNYFAHAEPSRALAQIPMGNT